MVPKRAPIQAPTDEPIIAPILNLSKHSPITEPGSINRLRDSKMLRLKVKSENFREFSQKEPNFYDFLLLEHYFDRSVKLRLDSSGDEADLREAHDISTIITKIIAILYQKFDGNSLPEYEFIEIRRTLAKFVGLAFFKLGRECLKTVGPNGSIKGPCCDYHRVEGLKEAHALFPKLLKPFGIELDRIDASSDTVFTSLLAVYADFNTQIIVSELILAARRSSAGLSRCLETLFEQFYGPLMEVSHLKGKLQSRAVQIRAILEQTAYSELEATLQAKYPRDLFESNLKNILINIYTSLPSTMLSELVNNTTKKLENGVYVASTEDKIENRSGEKRKIVKKQKQEKPEVVPEEERVKLKRADKLEDSLFKDVVIPGRFFRGILEPVDERFAAIIEGDDVNVKRYLAARKKKSTLNGSHSTHPGKILTNNVNKSNNKNALLERHNSAERISWETQELTGDESVTSQSKSEIGFRIIKDERTKNAFVQRSNVPRGRRRFSDAETSNLIEGIRRFGRDWRRILEAYPFEDRSNVDLKDKARNLEKLGLI